MMGWLEVPFEAVSPLFDEKSIRDVNPKTLTQKLSKAKAKSVENNYPNGIIIGSDSVVAFEGKILEKAEDIENQRYLIKAQRGKKALVYTSVYVINLKTGQEAMKTVIIPYKMANVTDLQIEEYIKSGKGLDKAGGFGLQDFDGMFLSSIDGCYTGALGFPMCEVSKILQRMRVSIVVNIEQVVERKTGRKC